MTCSFKIPLLSLLQGAVPLTPAEDVRASPSASPSSGTTVRWRDTSPASTASLACEEELLAEEEGITSALPGTFPAPRDPPLQAAELAR